MRKYVAVALVLAVIGFVALRLRRPNAEAVYHLAKPSDGVVAIKAGYPTGDFGLELLVRAQTPGTVLDTVGINAAPDGAWKVILLPDRHVAFDIWDGSDWRRLTTRSTIEPGSSAPVRFQRVGQVLRSWVNGVEDASLSVVTRLSGEPVYAGDFKGDESWGPKYNISAGMVGDVTIQYFGAPRTPPAATQREPEAPKPGGAPGMNPKPFGARIGDVTIAFAAGTAQSGSKLRMRRLPSPPAAPPPDMQPIRSLELTIGEQHFFANPITLKMPVPAGTQRPDQIRAALYDSVRKCWVFLPTAVEGSTIRLETQHLSVITLFLWQGLYGVAKTAHFHITWADAKLKADPARRDSAWAPKRNADTRDPIGVRKVAGEPGVPLYIQDLAQALEWSYQRYTTLGLPLPTWYRIDVVVGSMGDPFREKFTGVIWVPAKVDTPELLRHTAAHELFHTVEAKYLSMPGLTYREWLAESSADYAARYLVFPGSVTNDLISPAWFKTSLGSREDPHVYESAMFHDYLARTGTPFKPIFTSAMTHTSAPADYLAMGAQIAMGYARLELGYQDPELNRAMDLGAYERAFRETGKDLAEQFRGFVASVCLDRSVPISGPDTLLAGLDLGPTVLSSAEPKQSKVFFVAPDYTAMGWSIYKANDGGITPVTVQVQPNLGVGVGMDVFKVSSKTRTIGGRPRLATFASSNATRTVTADLADGEGLVLIASNAGREAGQVRAIVSFEGKVVVAPDTANGPAPFRKAFTASSTGLPSTMKSARMEWSVLSVGSQGARDIVVANRAVMDTRMVEVTQPGSFVLLAQLYDTSVRPARLVGTGRAMLTVTGGSGPVYQQVRAGVSEMYLPTGKRTYTRDVTVDGRIDQAWTYRSDGPGAPRTVIGSESVNWVPLPKVLSAGRDVELLLDFHQSSNSGMPLVPPTVSLVVPSGNYRLDRVLEGTAAAGRMRCRFKVPDATKGRFVLSIEGFTYTYELAGGAR